MSINIETLTRLVLDEINLQSKVPQSGVWLQRVDNDYKNDRVTIEVSTVNDDYESIIITIDGVS